MLDVGLAHLLSAVRVPIMLLSGARTLLSLMRRARPLLVKMTDFGGYWPIRPWGRRPSSKPPTSPPEISSEVGLFPFLLGNCVLLLRLLLKSTGHKGSRLSCLRLPWPTYLNSPGHFPTWPRLTSTALFWMPLPFPACILALSPWPRALAAGSWFCCYCQCFLPLRADWLSPFWVWVGTVQVHAWGLATGAVPCRIRGDYDPVLFGSTRGGLLPRGIREVRALVWSDGGCVN